MVGVVQNDLTDTSLLFIDTAGHGLSELITPDEESKGNEGSDSQINVLMMINCPYQGKLILFFTILSFC